MPDYTADDQPHVYQAGNPDALHCACGRGRGSVMHVEATPIADAAPTRVEIRDLVVRDFPFVLPFVIDSLDQRLNINPLRPAPARGGSTPEQHIPDTSEYFAQHAWWLIRRHGIKALVDDQILRSEPNVGWRGIDHLTRLVYYLARLRFAHPFYHALYSQMLDHLRSAHTRYAIAAGNAAIEAGLTITQRRNTAGSVKPEHDVSVVGQQADASSRSGSESREEGEAGV